MNWVEKLLTLAVGGLGGAVFTWVARIVYERRRKKRISLNTEKTRYTLPPLVESAEPSHHELKVAYNGITYAHLFSYSAVAKNVGYGSVTPYSLVFVMPKEANVLANFSRIEPVSNEIMIETRQNTNNLEYTFKLPRLEKGDTATINLLIDSANSQVRCIPRDADDVEFVVTSQRQGVSDLLVGLISLMMAVGSFMTILIFDSLDWKLTGKIIIWGFFLFSTFLTFMAFYFWKSTRPRLYEA
jgi:hypothetical protein